MTTREEYLDAAASLEQGVRGSEKFIVQNPWLSHKQVQAMMDANAVYRRMIAGWLVEAERRTKAKFCWYKPETWFNN